ncbi:MAG: hypothetical protein OEL83_10715 [Desulforhopalus sp.]|nr:hypothetical protein [Desulforhopalus sp.]
MKMIIKKIKKDDSYKNDIVSIPASEGKRETSIGQNRNLGQAELNSLPA